MKRYTMLLFLIILLGQAFTQPINHWETIIKTQDRGKVRVSDLCKYYIPNSDIGMDWITNDFNDNSWTTAASGIGYGDGDDATIIPEGTQCVYIRYQFTIEDKSIIKSLILDMNYDDGFVAYLNGTEIARANVTDPVSWDMELDNLRETVRWNPERFQLDEQAVNLLTNGDNILAVEVHNEQASSSDLSSNVFLHAGITSSEIIYKNPTQYERPLMYQPHWFWHLELDEEPMLFESYSLPLMIINTNDQTIPQQAPRITADMGLVYNGVGELNSDSDPWNEYSGKISIKHRGESTRDNRKKSFTIELQKADGSNNNVSILGLPEENDFALIGPYSDKTMIKNVLTYELFRRTGRWAPRTRYVEMIINGDYRGIYVLTETIKRDEERVDIDKLTPEDISAIDMSGGYLLRRDKTTGMDPNEYWNSFENKMTYQYFDPKFEDLTSNQATYIKDWMRTFDEALSGPQFSDPETGYSKYIKVKSFIDMMFVNEISKGVDNYSFSTYFHKENDADGGGKLKAGAPWDYNWAYGNDFRDFWSDAEGWVYTMNGRTYWFDRLMQDDVYKEKAYCRWTEFRSTIYSDENILSIIDSCITVMGDAVDRNFTRFPKLGQYVYPAGEPVPTTYVGEIEILKSWLLARLEWMDAQWLYSSPCSAPPTDITLSNSIAYRSYPSGTVIGDLSTVDEDSDEHTYSLVPGEGDNDNFRFSISGNSLKVLIPFTTLNSTELSVRVKSEDDGSQGFEKVFKIQLTDDEPSELDETFASQFALYPNPSSKGIQIVNTGNNDQMVAIELVEMSGKVLFVYSGQLNDVNASLLEDTRALRSGMYFVKINMDGNLKMLRFVKL